MALLPIFITKLQDLILVQNKWSSILNPFISNPSLQCSILKNVKLNGPTIINHLLAKKLTGWRLIGMDAPAIIYDEQSTNQTPSLTLILVSSVPVTVNLEVF